MQIKFRKNIRLKGYDYSMNGYYFVTIITRNRLPLLKLYKDAIEGIIKGLPNFINGLSIDYFKLMDDHIHIIFIFKDCVRPLGRVVSAMKYSITRIVVAGISSIQTVNGSGGITIPLKKTNDNLNMANSNSPATDKTIWQRNYYEHIIRNEESLQKIREYIDNNPLAEMMDWRHLEGQRTLTATTDCSKNV